MSKRIIKNAQLVNEGKVYSADVLINEDRIEKIDSVIDESGEEINGENLHLFPGVIDDQVHFREPGLTDKGCIKTESLAGVEVEPLHLWRCQMLFLQLFQKIYGKKKIK